MESNSSTRQLYQRHQLNHERHEVRVLVLEDGSEHDAVQCSMKSISLDDAPEFNALSYAWGDNTRSGSIIVDGIYTPVTKSAEIALRSLMAYEADSPSAKREQLLRTCEGRMRPIWIDTVCINQDDAEERADQVQLMRAIYSSAANVIVWMGESNPQTDEAFDLMRQRAAHKDFSLRPQLASQGQATFPPTPELMMLETIMKQDLCKRAWWSRLWVRQEFLLARKSPFMMCGDKGISWDWFIFYFIHLARSWTHPDVASQHTTQSGTAADNAWIGIPPISLHYLREDLKRRGTFPIDHAFRYLIRNALATDPRDHIYGLLGLVDEETASQIKVDYSIECMELYKQIARLLWRDYSSTMLAELLPAFHFHGEDNGFPSWIPDFRQSKLRGWQDRKSLQGSRPWRELDQSCFSEANDRLLLKGIYIDRIEAIHQTPMSLLDDPGLADKIKYYQSFLNEAQQRPVPAHHRLGVLAPMKRSESPMRTLTRSSVAQLEVDGKFHPRYTDEEVWNMFLSGSPLTHDGEDQDPPETEHLFLRLRRMLAAKVEGRCIFTSESGFGGVGVAGIEIGDVLALVFGATGPLVLRPYEGFYRLVGCTYVSGLMDVDLLNDAFSKASFREQQLDIH
jgi:hypothetical protein